MQDKKKKRAFDSKESRVKLQVYDPKNNSHVFYSFIKDDRKGFQYTINAMKERILKKYFNQRFRNAIFYNTMTDTVIERVSMDQLAQAVNSKVKLMVYDSMNQRREFFPNDFEDSQASMDFIMGAMHARVLQQELRGKFNAAIFYDVQTGNEITRVSPYRKVYKKKKETHPHVSP